MEFPVTRRHPGQQQIRHVGTGDQKHEANCTQQKEQSGA